MNNLITQGLKTNKLITKGFFALLSGLFVRIKRIQHEKVIQVTASHERSL